MVFPTRIKIINSMTDSDIYFVVLKNTCFIATVADDRRIDLTAISSNKLTLKWFCVSIKESYLKKE
ncbi:hypothetical protein HZS_2825 [Henneguya salminicola]|nr:hypothetical protein HZS_2825 [Henneguya salminicola]